VDVRKSGPRWTAASSTAIVTDTQVANSPAPHHRQPNRGGGTTVIGTVVDPGPTPAHDLRRHTSGSDGIIHTPDDVFLLPIAHAKVYILGQEDKIGSRRERPLRADRRARPAHVKIAVDRSHGHHVATGVFFRDVHLGIARWAAGTRRRGVMMPSGPRRMSSKVMGRRSGPGSTTVQSPWCPPTTVRLTVVKVLVIRHLRVRHDRRRGSCRPPGPGFRTVHV